MITRIQPHFDFDKWFEANPIPEAISLVSEIPNATQAQKSKVARELVTVNFDKDFADAVLSELENDNK